MAMVASLPELIPLGACTVNACVLFLVGE